MDLALLFRSLSHFELIWYVAFGKDPMSSFACGYLVVPGPSLENTGFSPHDSSGKKDLAVDVRVPLWTLDSLPLVCKSVFMPVFIVAALP